MAKNFNAGVSALSELGRTMLETLMRPGRQLGYGYLRPSRRRSRASRNSFLPQSGSARGKAWPCWGPAIPCDKVRDPALTGRMIPSLQRPHSH